MPTNNFKLFDENKANLLTDTEYGNSTQRLNGVQTGVASSQLNNKFAYQVSLVAYAIAQLMNANGLDASDTLAVSAFVGNLQGAILQKVADKATSAEAAAGVLSNKYITPETMKAAALLLSGGVMNGILDMGNNRITNLGTPTADSDAVTKGYVDGRTSQFVKVSNLTLNSAKSSSAYTPVGTFNTFTLGNINQIRSVRIKGICSIGAYTSNYGVTLFYDYSIDGNVVLLIMSGTRYTDFEIDLIIPATIGRYLDSSGLNKKGISCVGSPTRSRSNLATPTFSESSPPSVYTNDLYTHSFSCNIDMYLEVVD